jgi:hypothetical protein
MHLLYLDESGGDDLKATDKFFVLAGLSVFERVPFHLCRDVDEIQKKFIPSATEPIEFRASAIWSGNGEPWASMARPDRVALMKSVYRLIGGDGRITPFGIALEKPDYPSASPIQKTCEEIAGRFDAHLTGLELENHAEKQRGLMIFDQSRHEKTVQALLTQYRTTGASFGKVRHLAEVPLFTDSKITRMLQLADFVAYAIYRRYESSDAQFFDIILPRFTESAGKLHGLVHLTARFRECFCQPCFSHR